MKTIFFSILISAAAFSLSGNATAQGTLQFNQVLHFELAIQVAVPFTVPAGKVWKIESAGADNYNNPTVYLNNASGDRIAVLFLESNSYNDSQLPYWLPPSYSGQFYLNNTAGTQKGSVSIIEFNVIP